ncbi:hypothetical protein L226DRAFT_613293 [Lentinus tigrinus ALCF2SS1-7]|uniref:Uncharacterized protein n=1 Tax=Lentinus tigrinus ALCF2SS1-6 TaxID=1328759 RepID=A0A5C2SE15_9APHY|nr:hypothetical protein L227DRAFT_652111 [Lentinus tigrinus ALCF2SS1-6]RPD74447.1 hypothetical protein L226DRAFT_613293 [Lentinus tigrinus ALCF2SS1-7]
MPAISSSSHYHLPKLNSPNLRTLDSIRTHKPHLLQTFIRSQEAHLSSYAREGKSLASSWESGVGDIMDHAPARTKRRRDVELESGFGTPLLKPRAQARASRSVIEDREKIAESEVADNSPMKPKESVKTTRTQPSGKRAKENVRAVQERSETREEAEERAPKRLRQSGIQEFVHPWLPTREVTIPKRDKHKDAQPEMAKKKGRDDEVDEEHRHRLAERRNRRRAKKAIVDPKPPPADSQSSEEDDLPKGKETKKTTKKGKGLNIPAGLALMHGFSAKNIGKNRLTMNLDPMVGVFNKGKASAKTSVKKSKTMKPYLQLFSEERFLSKAATEDTSRRRRDGGQQPSDSDDSETEERRPSPKTKSKSAVIPGPSSKLKRSRSPSPASTTQDEHVSDASEAVLSPARKQRKPAREDSPVWDIELDDGQLPSGTGSGRSVPSDGEEDTKLCGTVLLDTGAFTSRWVVPEKHHPPTKSGLATPAVEPSAAPESEISSIAPSHSASHVVSRQDEVGHITGWPSETFSRYFAVPIDATADPKRELAMSREGPPPLVSQSHLRKEGDPPPRVDNSTSAVNSQDCGHLSASLRSNLGDHFQATEQESHIGLASGRASSPRVEADIPFSLVLRPTSRSSSLPLPLGPCSPASPGHLTEDLDDGMPQAILNVLAASTNQDAHSVDWNMHAAMSNNVPTFLSEADRSGHMGGDRSYVQDADEMALQDPMYFVDPYTVEEEVPDFAMPPPIPAFEARVAYDHDSAYWEHPQGDGTVEEEYYDFLHPDGVSMKANDYGTSHIAVDVGAADEDEFRWPAGGAEHEEMEPSHSFFPGDLDDDCLSSEAGFASSEVASADALESDDALEAGDPSALGALPRFSQGRALLLGVADTEADDGYGGCTGMSTIEQDVARSLRGHWLPQKF